MIRYTTMHIIKEFEDIDGRIEIDIEMVDSNNPYPDIEVIKNLIHTGYNIKGNAMDRIMRLLSNRVARYVFKAYPYVISLKVKAISENGESLELNLVEPEVTDGEENGQN